MRIPDWLYRVAWVISWITVGIIVLAVGLVLLIGVGAVLLLVAAEIARATDLSAPVVLTLIILVFAALAALSSAFAYPR
jgi:hypothetical protein